VLTVIYRKPCFSSESLFENFVDDHLPRMFATDKQYFEKLFGDHLLEISFSIHETF